MHKNDQETAAEKPEKLDAFWHRVYLAVVLTTVSTIAALWLFSTYFSK